METAGKTHEEDQNPIKDHGPFKEDFGSKPRGKSSPEGSRKRGNYIGSPHDHSRPDQGLLGSKRTDFKDIEGDKGKNAMEGKGDSELRNSDKKNTFIFNLKGLHPEPLSSSLLLIRVCP
jgi:hypothetical protein